MKKLEGSIQRPVQAVEPELQNSRPACTNSAQRRKGTRRTRSGILPLGCGSDDDHQALRCVFQTGLHVNAVDPEVDVAFGREIRGVEHPPLIRRGPLHTVTNFLP
jgi:hypothetical protein